jgi:hypothetical protein
MIPISPGKAKLVLNQFVWQLIPLKPYRQLLNVYLLCVHRPTAV